MADKGFTVEDLLPLGVSLNIPPFFRSKGQISPQEVVETQSIAFLCIHVERAINKIKKFPHIGQYSTIHNVWGCKPNVVSVCYVM